MAKKLKGKVWYPVIAPIYFGGKEISVTPASEEKMIVGRRLTLPVVEITGNMEKYYMKVTFRIVKVKEGKAFTEFDGFECMRDYIARMVVRRVRRIDVIQDEITKDGKKLRIKSIAIISRKAKTNVERKIRKKIEELVKNFTNNLTLEGFIKKVLSDELKNSVLKEIAKIYPPRHFEFRKIERLDLQEKLKEVPSKKVEEKEEKAEGG